MELLVTWKPDRETIDSIRSAITATGALDYLRVHHTAIAEFYAAAAGFIGGSLDDVDAFLTNVPDPASGEHRVFWLRGNSFGSLALAAHEGPEGANLPAKISGYVRSVSDIQQVLVIGTTADWPFSGGSPRTDPDIEVQFADGVVVPISVSSRQSSYAKEQAATFVDKLLAAVAQKSSLGPTLRS
jgi:hypothetical protein